MTCFWCGKPLGFFHTPVAVCGVLHEVHAGWLKNCAAEYNKWHDQPDKKDEGMFLPRMN